MTRETFAIVAVIFIALLVGLGLLGWWVRRRRQRDIPAPAPVPEGFVARFSSDILYVATTMADNEYDRIAVHGLGLRSRASLIIGDGGIVLSMPDTEVFTPVEDLREVQRATWTIDRAVEPGGLLRYAWRLGAREVATNVRVIGDDGETLKQLLALLSDEDTKVATQAGKES